jgi:hypothetical protein
VKPADRRWYRDPDYGRLPPTPEQAALRAVFEEELSFRDAFIERMSLAVRRYAFRFEASDEVTRDR